MRALLAGLVATLLFATAATAAPAIWVVRDRDSELVLFGSIHVLPPGVAWRTPALDTALARADDLWFELPVDKATEQEVARLAAATGVLPLGQSLFRLLPPADAERLAKVAAANGVDRLTLDRLEPWLAEVALGAAAYAKAGADVQHGVEQAISAAAPGGVRRQALETPAQQMRLFDQAPFDEQVASLRETLKELEHGPAVYRSLLRAWQTGDVHTLDREALQPLRRASPVLFHRLVTDRNAAWTRTLDGRLKGAGRTVVVVGVGHLVGRDSVPARLRALGYSVTGP